jgi:hypothetical protein
MGSVLGNVLGDASEGSILGEILGELDGLDSESLGAVEALVGRARRHRHHGHRHGESMGGGKMALHVDEAPRWRGRQLAAGVNAPGEGVVPLPMNAINNAGPGGTGVWTAGFGSQITFQGQIQKPYKAKRLLATTQRVGTTATALMLGQIFVGVDLNQAQLFSVDLEALGAPTAFDTGMSLMQAPPGVIISILAILGGTAPTGTDSITGALAFLGHIIH